MSNTQIKVVGFVPILKGLPGEIATRAFILCVKCGDPISSSGGPVPGALCLDCAATVLLAAAGEPTIEHGPTHYAGIDLASPENQAAGCDKACRCAQPVCSSAAARMEDPFGVRRG